MVGDLEVGTANKTEGGGGVQSEEGKAGTQRQTM